jgi:hypothetical protein
MKVVGNLQFRVKNRPKWSPDASDTPRLLKGTTTISGFRKLVMWLTQTLAIGDQFGQATNSETYGPF